MLKGLIGANKVSIYSTIVNDGREYRFPPTNILSACRVQYSADPDQIRVCPMKKNWIAALALFTCAICYQAGAEDRELPIEYRYTLLPGDALEISVWQEPDLQREVLIRPDGWFSFPLVGDVRAKGRTVSQIGAELTEYLKRYISDVVLTVSVVGIGGNKVFVIGQVEHPGVFTVNPRVDVVQALSIAGGMTPFAAVNNILILRRESGRQTTFKFAYGDIEKGRNLEQNIQLEPGDVVIVP